MGEKAADVLPDAIRDCIYQYEGNASFLILGSGEPHIEARLNDLKTQIGGYYNNFIGYNEALSHQIYAGADFLLMPSRVEPCGLNQMYALRYGTVPIVRSTGGLKDTVKDFGSDFFIKIHTTVCTPLQTCPRNYLSASYSSSSNCISPFY